MALLFWVLWFVLQAAWIVDETDEDDSDNGDSEDNSMVLDRGEDSNQERRYDQEFEDDEKSLNLRDLDTETQNESEMMVYISSTYFCDLQQYL